jgi:hypothetical protein
MVRSTVVVVAGDGEIAGEEEGDGLGVGLVLIVGLEVGLAVGELEELDVVAGAELAAGWVWVVVEVFALVGAEVGVFCAVVVSLGSPPTHTPKTLAVFLTGF